jgi:hypothetical protein
MWEECLFVDRIRCDGRIKTRCLYPFVDLPSEVCDACPLRERRPSWDEWQSMLKIPCRKSTPAGTYSKVEPDCIWYNDLEDFFDSPADNEPNPPGPPEGMCSNPDLQESGHLLWCERCPANNAPVPLRKKASLPTDWDECLFMDTIARVGRKCHYPFGDLPFDVCRECPLRN